MNLWKLIQKAEQPSVKYDTVYDRVVAETGIKP